MITYLDTKCDVATSQAEIAVLSISASDTKTWT